ncbi:Retrovirus-related Pol polyprotein from transposon 17.6 [Dictyocoela muelleri]|nr:Retrovirus-related Pol polyprotein from transposon 17.6 [Dictyocoela muelleri]
MQNELGDLEYVKIYLDDVLIHSKNIEDHENHVVEVCSRLFKSGLSINMEKSCFAKEEVEYLGHFITPRGYYPNTHKINILKNKPLPTNKKQLQRLLGIFNWFRPFLKDISNKLLFMTDKLRNKITKIFWSDVEAKKIREVWDEIKNASGLKYPNFSEIFLLETDASERGIGGILYQRRGILGYYSYKLNQSEQNYSIVEKEAYAVYKTVTHFRTILLNGNVIVKTDNRNILFKAKNHSTRINRWKKQLAKYKLDIKHINGKENVMADYLSRKIPKEESEITLLTKQFDILEIHKNLGHPGKLRTYYTLKLKYNFKKPYKSVVTELDKCLECNKNTISKIKHGKISGKIISNRPFETISSDIVGTFKTNLFEIETQNNEFYIITITDIFSRFTKVYLLEEISSKSIIENAFKKFIKKDMNIEKCITDNGRQYTSSEFNEFLNSKKIKHIKTSPYNPQSNGISERINQTILKVLKIFQGLSINYILKTISKNLNNVYNTSIKNFPRQIIELYKSKPTHQIFQKIKQLNSNSKKRNLVKINRNRNNNEFKIGDQVLLKNFKIGKLEEKLVFLIKSLKYMKTKIF